ncbi:hypothetical protein [Kangiella sp. TOML190]|uniref:hypothetical protein n=1 Tax=Kangiella sp. TOML190 TaxID=2931351 RepID=UPI00203F00E0|nr:hypothetical protein [Kangiella sp. TOML190]
MNIFHLVKPFILVIFLVSCAHVPEQPQPQNISFEKAMEQIALGLQKFNETSQQAEQSFGLVPAEVVATFNIGVVTSGQNQTSLTVNPANLVSEVHSFGTSWNYEASSEKSNTIEIKFRNLLFAKSGEAFYDKDDIGELIQKLKDAGIDVHYTK